jgi:hypothetical protein
MGMFMHGKYRVGHWRWTDGRGWTSIVHYETVTCSVNSHPKLFIIPDRQKITRIASSRTDSLAPPKSLQKISTPAQTTCPAA